MDWPVMVAPMAMHGMAHAGIVALLCVVCHVCHVLAHGFCPVMAAPRQLPYTFCSLNHVVIHCAFLLDKLLNFVLSHCAASIFMMPGAGQISIHDTCALVFGHSTVKDREIGTAKASAAKGTPFVSS